jgi:hypothetical protein
MTKGKAFCHIVASYNLLAEIIRVYGSISEAKRHNKYEFLVNKYILNEKSMMNLKYKELGEFITDDMILEYYNRIKMLPQSFQKTIIDTYFTREIKIICGLI